MVRDESPDGKPRRRKTKEHSTPKKKVSSKVDTKKRKHEKKADSSGSDDDYIQCIVRITRESGDFVFHVKTYEGKTDRIARKELRKRHPRLFLHFLESMIAAK